MDMNNSCTCTSYPVEHNAAWCEAAPIVAMTPAMWTHFERVIIPRWIVEVATA